MSEREQRITELLDELRSEMTAGLLSGEIDGLSFWFYVLATDNTATFCQLRTERVPAFDLDMTDLQPRLRFGRTEARRTIVLAM